MYHSKNLVDHSYRNKHPFQVFRVKVQKLRTTLNNSIWYGISCLRFSLHMPEFQCLRADGTEKSLIQNPS